MNDDLLSTALACIRSGLSIIPIDHTTKKPASRLLPRVNEKPTWKPYQSEIADEPAVRRWCESGIKSFAVVCGNVSGGLLVLDFDVPEFYATWSERVGDLARRLPAQRTGGGGYQVLLRCAEPGPNARLAWVRDENDPSGRTIAIETRGEGGYAIVAPSQHPNGTIYQMVSGTLTEIPTLTQAQAAALLEAARDLDAAPFSRQQQKSIEVRARAAQRTSRADMNGQASVIDTFNDAHPIELVLERHGYIRGRSGRFIRPGGESESVSILDGRSFHWSSDDPLCDGRAHDAFDVFTHYEHAGDVVAAMRTAAKLLNISAPHEDLIPKHEPVEPYRPFPVDVLPPVVARFISEGAEALGCDPAFIALPLLAELASAIGNSRRIRLKRSWTEPPVLWCVMVADSGTLKSPAFDLALGPVQLRQKRAMKEFQRAQAEYAEAKEKYDAAIKDWRKAAREDRSEMPQEPERPVCERLLCSDTTVEALADRLTNAPRGLLVARDEFAGWMGSFNQYKQGQGGDVAHWLELQRAGSLLVDRKTGDKTMMHVPRAAVCIAGGIQPQILGRCLTREFFDNGLAARLLLAMPPKRAKYWREADIDETTMQSVTNLFNELLRLAPTPDLDGDPQPADVELDPGAKAVWIEFYNEHAQEQAELDGELSAAWSKLEGYAARFALVLHCVRQVTERDVDPWRVDEQSIAAGVALARWFGHEAKRVYATLTAGNIESRNSDLVSWIEAHGGQTTIRQLTHRNRRYRNKCELAEADLEHLVQSGRGRWQTPRQNSKGGRPQRVFHLFKTVTKSPDGSDESSVTVTETPANGDATGGFGDGDAGDGEGNDGSGDAGIDDDVAEELERAALRETGM
jgi:hypothetical protein